MPLADPADVLKQAITLQQAGRLKDAAALCRPYLKQNAPDILNLLGILELQQGRFAEGVAALDRSLQINPLQHQTLCNRGFGLEALGMISEAEKSYAHAVELAPEYARAHANHANVLDLLGRSREALDAANRALAINSSMPDAHCNRSNALRKLARLEEALASIDKALELAPRIAVLHNNRANILRDLQRPKDALAAFDIAIALDPAYAEAHTNRGNVLRDLKRYEEAIESHNKAIAIAPQSPTAYWNKSLVALLTGDYEEGWRLFEWRWQSDSLKNSVRTFNAPLWLGAEDIHGKTLLVYAEQGYGDTVQFCRYIPQLLKQNIRIIFEAPRSLLPLLITLDGADNIMFVAAGDTIPEFDYQIPLMSLPLVFDTRIETIPAAPHYLSISPQRKKRWQKRLGEKARPRIGICWSGRPGQAPDRKRSAALADFAPLFALPFDFHVLQKDIRTEDRELLPCFENLTAYSSELMDFADTAALIGEMDLCLSVDTSVAHVAGAIGATVWLMLPWVAEWRWLAEREDSPWYPTAALLRQPDLNDWAGLMASTKSRLIAYFQPR